MNLPIDIEQESDSNGVARGSRRRNLKDEVATGIRALIFSGALRPGQKLDQDAICDQLQVSRLPVREAIITLEEESLVEQIPRRGVFIARITREDILDHWAMWGAVSGIAARRAAERMDTSDIDALRAIVEREAFASDESEHYSCSIQFHRLINLVGASRRLKAALRNLDRAVPARLNTEMRNWELGHAEHQALIRALASGDGRKAESVMAEHLSRSGIYAVQALEAQGFWKRDDTVN